MYLLIGVWGSGRKEYAAMKLYTNANGWFCIPTDRNSWVFFMVQAVKL